MGQFALYRNAARATFGARFPIDLSFDLVDPVDLVVEGYDQYREAFFSSIEQEPYQICWIGATQRGRMAVLLRTIRPKACGHLPVLPSPIAHVRRHVPNSAATHD